MAHFAEIGLNNKVLRIVVISDNELLDQYGKQQESKGIEYCHNIYGGVWIQTGKDMRVNFAGIGYTYDTDLDAFVPPKPYNSWSFSIDTGRWMPPTDKPEDENGYEWNEETQTWDVITLVSDS